MLFIMNTFYLYAPFCIGMSLLVMSIYCNVRTFVFYLFSYNSFILWPFEEEIYTEPLFCKGKITSSKIESAGICCESTP